MTRTAQLHELQVVDTALDSRVTRIKQIDGQMAEGEEVVSARSANDEAQTRLSESETRLRALLREVEESTSRLRTQEKRMYDGSVKNPKELSQMQEEVGHLRARIKEREDDVLEAMMVSEEATSQAEERAEALKVAAHEWEQFKAGLMEERDKLLGQAKVLQVKRQRMISTLPWADLQVYERLRRAKAGLAVAEVSGGLCAGCHVAIPAHILRLARTSEGLVNCPSCGRILFPVGEIRFHAFDHDLDNIDR